MVDGVSGHAVAIESVISGTAGCIAIAGAGADTSATAAAGEGGLITFADSNWLASIVLPHQPHFLGQPRNIDVFWGYGLLVDRPGNFIKKPMSECTGREIMTEILGHLQSESDTQRILLGSTSIPCMMPFITSQFLPREKAIVRKWCPQAGRIWRSPGSSANWRTMSCLPLSTQSALPRRQCTHCSDLSASHQPSARKPTIQVFCVGHSGHFRSLSEIDFLLF